MSITNVINKKSFNDLLISTSQNSGQAHCSFLLDSLKLLGFYYATHSGLSISLEDLNISISKKIFLDNFHEKLRNISVDCVNGEASQTERYQMMIDGWIETSEILKNQIIEVHKSYDPFNTLFLMAFSGARGNMSQVRQILGIRGLMVDQGGNVIDIPIPTNFREGLTPVDYIISSYGARKGVVDTALKTADAGYLTRRLVFTAQNIVIKEVDCQSNRGIYSILTTLSPTDDLLGRLLLAVEKLPFLSPLLFQKNALISSSTIEQFKKEIPLVVKYRSPFTCQSSYSVCQYCYGKDYSTQKLVSLGESVGIIAAQSIGEPGTQLTMRTFHTGGVFLGQKEIIANFSNFAGKLYFSPLLQISWELTKYGKKQGQLMHDHYFYLLDSKNNFIKFFLKKDSLLNFEKPCYFPKNFALFEEPSLPSVSGRDTFRALLSPFDGEIIFEKVKKERAKQSFSIKENSQHSFEDGQIWITSGKIYNFPAEAYFPFTSFLSSEIALCKNFVVSPIQGFVKITSEFLSITNHQTTLKFPFKLFSSKQEKLSFVFSPFIKNFQYVDSFSVLGAFYYVPQKSEKIEKIKPLSIKYWKKLSRRRLFIVAESDTWTFYRENFLKLKRKVFAGDILEECQQASENGIFLRSEGSKQVYQKAFTFPLRELDIFKATNKNWIKKNSLLGYSLVQSLKGEDIIQGLAKIAKVFEVESNPIKATLSLFPSLVFPSLKRGVRSKSFVFDSLFASHIFSNDFFFKINSYRKNLESVSNKRNSHLSYFYEDFVENFGSSPITVHRSFTPYEKNLLFLKEKFVRKPRKNIFSPCFFSSSLLQNYHNRPDVYSRGEIGNFCYIGQPLTEGELNANLLINAYYFFFSTKYDQNYALVQSFGKLRLILRNTIQAGYAAQDVFVGNKHVELIIREMSSNFLFEGPLKEKFAKSFIFGIYLRLSSGYHFFESIKEVGALSSFYSSNVLKKTRLDFLEQIKAKKILLQFKAETETQVNKAKQQVLLRQKKKKELFEKKEQQITQKLYTEYLFFRPKVLPLPTKCFESNQNNRIHAILPSFMSNVLAFMLYRYLSLSKISKIFPSSSYFFPLKPNLLIENRNKYLKFRIDKEFFKFLQTDQNFLRILYKTIRANKSYSKKSDVKKLEINHVFLFEKFLSQVDRNFLATSFSCVSKKKLTAFFFQGFFGKKKLVFFKGFNFSLFMKVKFLKNSFGAVSIDLSSCFLRHTFRQDKETLKKTAERLEELLSIQLPSVFFPTILGLTSASLNKIGFLSASSFQEPKRVLTKSALLGEYDWFDGLKESVIAGKLLTGGSSFFLRKTSLDSLCFFKERIQNCHFRSSRLKKKKN